MFADSFEQGVEKHLGDIVISPGYVYRQCKRDEVNYVLFHSLDYVIFTMIYDFVQRDASVGDLYLNTDAGVSKAMSTVFDVNKRINLLLIHGILHLLGHDHEVSEDWKVMTTREDELIKRLHEMKV